MLAIAFPTSFFSMKEGSSSELETPESSWKESFGAIWKTHRNSILIGSGLAIATAFTAVLYARPVTVPEPTNPFPTCPAPHFPVLTNIYGFCESRSIEALPKQSSIPSFPSQIGISKSQNVVSSLVGLAESQITKLDDTASLDSVVSSKDSISHNSHQAPKEDSFIATDYPVSDFPKLKQSAPNLFSPDPKAVPWRVFSSDIPISLISLPSTSANCSIDALAPNEVCLDSSNQDNSTIFPPPLISTVEKSNILTQAWESVAPMAYDRLSQFSSYIENSLSEGRNELFFNPFSLRVVYDIGLLGGALYYTHSRGIHLSPGEKSLLAVGAVKTFRDIFMPPMQPSFTSSVIKIFSVVIVGYLKLSGVIN